MIAWSSGAWRSSDLPEGRAFCPRARRPWEISTTRCSGAPERPGKDSPPSRRIATRSSFAKREHFDRRDTLSAYRQTGRRFECTLRARVIWEPLRASKCAAGPGRLRPAPKGCGLQPPPHHPRLFHITQTSAPDSGFAPAPVSFRSALWPGAAYRPAGVPRIGTHVQQQDAY